MGGPQDAHTHEWSNSLWDCFSPTDTCLFGWCLPCMLHGKTSSRLEDPAMQDETMMNGNCLIYLFSSYCVLHWIPLMMKRGEIRKRFNIEGSGLGDCFSSYCCPCCTLVQNDKEMDAQANRGMQPPSATYQPPAGMAYPPPQ